MKKLFHTVFLAAALLPLISFAEGFVWKVDNDKNQTLYLGGTIHVLAANDYPLPKVFDMAYQASNSLIFEMDLGLQNTQAFQQSMAALLFYQDGHRLDEVLGASVWLQFIDWCKANKLPPEQFLGMKPGLVAITISMTELMKMGVNQEGVDSYFYNKAIADKKPLLGLETAEEQLNFLATMGGERPDKLIAQTLDEVDEIPTLFPKVKKAWREGNAPLLNSLMVDDMKNNYPEVYRSLLLERNHNWLRKLEAEINDDGVEFVLVGAAHLVGEDGLLALLKAKGYRLTAAHE
ncbi:MAG: TraB/GumN family protein [Sinobacterium sp.]|nr:TraB/GumN family protein [Sinobacterium sp.]